MTHASTLEKHAIEYAEMGWHVFPLIPNTKKPLTPQGYKNATTNLNKIHHWWSRNPKANIGISTGTSSQIFVIDIDRKNGVDGLESIKGNAIPACPTVKTPTGGYHYYFAQSKPLKTRVGALSGVDFKSDGGYVVAPPSIVDSKPYTWDLDHDLNLPPQSIPDWVFNVTRQVQKVEKIPNSILEGQGRNNHLTSLAGSMKRRGVADAAIKTALESVNQSICKPPLADNELAGILRSTVSWEAPKHVEKPQTIPYKCTKSGVPLQNVDNVCLILESHPKLKDTIWYDDFYRKVMTAEKGLSRPWVDSDDIALTRFLQRNTPLSTIPISTVAAAVKLYASENTQCEPRNWVKSLDWDGVPRIDHFFIDVFEAEDNEYTRKAARNFFIGMIARIFEPGCQVDNMIVLEGAQGIGKSSALRALGGKWHTAAKESVENKDFLLILNGHLIIEIEELDSFRKAEITRIKQVVSNPCDNYRSPYDRYPKAYPRMCVFVGTTNETHYLKDNTGARRFWPIMCHCTNINIQNIKTNRAQYFAEAYHHYKEGSLWFEMPDSATKDEQESRRVADVWEDVVEAYHDQERSDHYTVQEIATKCLEISVKDINKLTEMRIASVLKHLKFTPTRIYIGDQRQRVWKSPA